MKKNNTTLEDKMVIVDAISEYIFKAVETQASAAVGLKAKEIRMMEKENDVLRRHVELLKQERKANQYDQVVSAIESLEKVIECGFYNIGEILR